MSGHAIEVKKKYTGIELMRDAPVGTAIIRLALPMILAMLAQSIHSMIDMFFIGRTNDPNMVAAIALVMPVFFLSQALGNVFAVGGSSYISRLLGAGNKDEARHTSTVSLYTGFGLAVLLALGMLLFKTPILQLIGTSGATYVHTDNYFSVIVMFMPVAASSVVISAQIRSEGETQKAMRLQLIGIALNVVLTPIFVLGLRMGTAGAAWSTAAGQSLSFLYGVRYLLSKTTIMSMRPRDYKPARRMMTQILSIGIPSGISQIVMSASNILSNRILASYGDHVVAGNGVQMRIVSMCFMLVFALVNGYQPFAGYNYGAKQYDRLRKGFRLTLIYATGLCVVASVVMRIFGAYFIQFFISDALTIEAGAAIMRVFLWGLPFIGLQIIMMVSFQAFGKPLQAMIISLGRQCLLYLPLMLALNYLFGFEGFIWALPAADILTTGIAVALGWSLFKLMRGGTDAPAKLI